MFQNVQFHVERKITQPCIQPGGAASHHAPLDAVWTLCYVAVTVMRTRHISALWLSRLLEGFLVISTSHKAAARAPTRLNDNDLAHTTNTRMSCLLSLLVVSDYAFKNSISCTSVSQWITKSSLIDLYWQTAYKLFHFSFAFILRTFILCIISLWFSLLASPSLSAQCPHVCRIAICLSAYYKSGVEWGLHVRWGHISLSYQFTCQLV